MIFDGEVILHRSKNKVVLYSDGKSKEVFAPMTPYSFNMQFDEDDRKVNHVLKRIQYFFNGIRRLSPYTSPTIHIAIREEENRIVEPDGHNLSGSFEYMRRNNSKLYETVVKDACRICEITDIIFKKAKFIDLPIDIMHLVEPNLEYHYPISDAAGGICRIFALLNIIYAPGPKSLVCIDEIDSNLDAIKIDHIIKYLQDNREIFPQILAISHNPYFQDRCDLKEWIVVEKKGAHHFFNYIDQNEIDPLFNTGLYGNSRLFKEGLYDKEQLPLLKMK